MNKLEQLALQVAEAVYSHRDSEGYELDIMLIIEIVVGLIESCDDSPETMASRASRIGLLERWAIWRQVGETGLRGSDRRAMTQEICRCCANSTTADLTEALNEALSLSQAA